MPHTPGPWLNRHWNKNSQIEVVAPEFHSCRREPLMVINPAYTHDPEKGVICTEAQVNTAEANARLASAAPDLLAALENLLAEIVWLPSESPSLHGTKGRALEIRAEVAHDLVEACKATIQVATGRAVHHFVA